MLRALGKLNCCLIKHKQQAVLWLGHRHWAVMPLRNPCWVTTQRWQKSIPSKGVGLSQVELLVPPSLGNPQRNTDWREGSCTAIPAPLCAPVSPPSPPMWRMAAGTWSSSGAPCALRPSAPGGPSRATVLKSTSCIPRRMNPKGPNSLRGTHPVLRKTSPATSHWMQPHQKPPCPRGGVSPAPLAPSPATRNGP